jgi:fatty acid desaturase
MVDPALVASLKRPRPSAVYSATALIWLQIVLSWSLALFGPLWLAWIPFIVHCAVTQGMLLWVHEASHFHLLSGRRSNDVWCDIFFAGPIGMSAASYRLRHLSHHAHLGTAQDADSYPYRQSIKGAPALAWVLIKTLSGFMGLWLAVEKYGLSARRAAGAAVSPRWLAPVVTAVFNLALLGACVATGRWYLYFVLWVYPILAVAITLNIVRTIAEHQPQDYPRIENGEVTMVAMARTTVPNRFEKWLMYQASFNYHVEHHLFPAIPQHNLVHLHRHLLAKGFYERFPGCVQRSGFAKFIQLSRNRTHDDFTDPVEDALAT